jgi:hypothetical protein
MDNKQGGLIMFQTRRIRFAHSSPNGFAASNYPVRVRDDEVTRIKVNRAFLIESHGDRRATGGPDLGSSAPPTHTGPPAWRTDYPRWDWHCGHHRQPLC